MTKYPGNQRILTPNPPKLHSGTGKQGPTRQEMNLFKDFEEQQLLLTS